jgi:nicotinamidase-related amidase
VTTTNSKTHRSMIDPGDAIILLIDHQSGLLQTVKDIDTEELRGNIIALAKLAKLLKLPVITTASVPDGPNGPMIPEIKEIVPDAIYVPRKGQINAWDNVEFIKAVKGIGRKTLVMAGTLSNVCLAFPAICAVADGYKVYALMDASGCWNKFSKDIVLARMVQAGVIPTDMLALIAELQQTWARPEASQFAEFYADRMPNYKLLMECYGRAEQVAKSGPRDAKQTTTMDKLDS